MASNVLLFAFHLLLDITFDTNYFILICHLFYYYEIIIYTSLGSYTFTTTFYPLTHIFSPHILNR